MGERQRVSGSIEIAAGPEQVYSMVSDLPRMGEWSPEATGGKWAGKAEPGTVGARFKGKNRNGNKTWSAAVVVTEATAAQRFAFTTVAGPIKAAHWSYEITPSATGCTVTETWVDTRPGFVVALGKVLTGVPDRAAFTQTSIEVTLANLKQAAEPGS
ncbi:MAG: SRPBCC family protein [Sporichthyaceae bacterium]